MDTIPTRKIAYIVPRFHPFKGGAEQNILAMAERMVQKGHDVTVYTTNIKFRSERLPKNETYKGIKIVRNWSLNDWLYAGFYPMLFIRLIRNKYDIVHVSGFGFLWVEFCLIFKKLFSRKSIFINTPHGPFMALGDTKGIRGFARKNYNRILKFLIPKMYNGIIAVVDKQKEWITKDYNVDNSKIFTVPNGIDSNYIEKSIIQHSNDEKVLITYLNRIEWYKGMQDVVSALALLRDKGNTNFEFLIMGRSGGYTETLKRLIEEKSMQDLVKFKFSPSDEERDEIFYKNSQINILPSKWEGTGIILIEAMAKGNAIITTNQNQAVDMLIIPDKSGYSYDFGDIEALSKILEKLIEDYKLRQEIRKHNITFAKNFTWESVFPKYTEMIDTLISKKNV
jgi:glycosyltransferase involved in cell wall biosynthesis